MRRSIPAILTAIAAFVLAVSPSLAADNVAAGRTIAETWCSPCHAVGKRQASDVAPPFSEILARRTRQEIATFLADPHGQMPNIQLARQQIADIVAYMATLK
jgi:mono/diheme cytochrome c family protein